MRIITNKIIIPVIVIFFLIAFSEVFVYADTPAPSDSVAPSESVTPTPTNAPENNSDQLKALNDKIHDLESKVSDLHNQEDSLSTQIDVMDSQIKLTEYRINSTEQQIDAVKQDIAAASKRMKNLDGSLNNVTKVLLNRIVATYQTGNIDTMQLLLSSKNTSDLLSRANYLQLVQEHDKRLLYDTQQAKNDYANQKVIFENKKKKIEALQTQLQDYTKQLDQQKIDKKKLLSETQGDEQNYQNLLSQAKAQLAGFTSFVTAAGGGLTNFGNGSNGWYYTQRDPQWGNMSLPGSSTSVFTAGCAVTSVAMVCKSYGQNVTPATIVSDSSKFIGGDLWNWAFSCDGKSTNWIGSSSDQVKSYVENGTPVILRLSAPSVSGLHFVVAWKWDGSDFIIHDPYYGPDKKFSERYDWSQVTTALVIH